MSHTALQRLNAASRAVLSGSNGAGCYGRNPSPITAHRDKHFEKTVISAGKNFENIAKKGIFAQNFKYLKKLSDYFVFLQRDF